jgi:hypothetical protein
LHVTIVGALESGGLELNAKETKLLVCAYLLKKMEEEINLLRQKGSLSKMW